VRTALECPAEKLNFSLDQVSIKVIQNAIEQNLTRGYKVKLRPYKVNIYKEGGFFKGHVDTPREGMVGTLVLFGAHEHTGGELVVYHNNTSRTFKAVPNPGKDELSWAAFFSDCVHEVLPVKSGKRVSLTFDILLEESISPEIRLRDENSDLLELISTIDNSPVECLGLLLTFKYTLDNINNSHLKVNDR
jgi:predicted 2-oxoglutarate/Fe(II)-dependent dioxygenase YbiX